MKKLFLLIALTTQAAFANPNKYLPIIESENEAGKLVRAHVRNYMIQDPKRLEEKQGLTEKVLTDVVLRECSLETKYKSLKAAFEYNTDHEKIIVPWSVAQFLSNSFLQTDSDTGPETILEWMRISLDFLQTSPAKGNLNLKTWEVFASEQMNNQENQPDLRNGFRFFYEELLCSQLEDPSQALLLDEVGTHYIRLLIPDGGVDVLVCNHFLSQFFSDGKFPINLNLTTRIGYKPAKEEQNAVKYLEGLKNGEHLKDYKTHFWARNHKNEKKGFCRVDLHTPGEKTEMDKSVKFLFSHKESK